MEGGTMPEEKFFATSVAVAGVVVVFVLFIFWERPMEVANEVEERLRANVVCAELEPTGANCPVVEEKDLRVLRTRR